MNTKEILDLVRENISQRRNELINNENEKERISRALIEIDLKSWQEIESKLYQTMTSPLYLDK